MIHDCNKKIISVIKLGKLPIDEVTQVLFLANQVQKKFLFEYSNEELPLDEKYKLENGGYDLCRATKSLVSKSKYRKLSRPLIVISAEALGRRENGTEPDYFYFLSKEDDYDPNITVISIQPLKYLPKTRSLQDYLLMLLSTYILTQYGDFSFHDDTCGCLFDYCDELSDMEQCFLNGSLCEDCERRLQNIIRQGNMSLEEVSAAIRLLNRSVRKKYCFIAMPFNPKYDDVKTTISNTLTEIGWEVYRADEIIFPRFIISKILLQILTCDLVIADLTGSSPNVFYEVGFTHSLGNDLILLTQEDKIPIDLAHEQTIYYQGTELTKLKDNLKKSISLNIK